MSPGAAEALRVPALRLDRVRTREALVSLGLLALLCLASAWIRTRALGSSLWIDEGISVGIAQHPLSAIPHLLRQDGAPPLYYVLLHWWLDIAGDREARTHLLSVGFALLAIPAGLWAGWSLFGRRAGWLCAVLLAVNPFLTVYAQETRMYSLLVPLGVVACGAYAHVFAFRRRGHLPLFAIALALLLYTHNWAEFVVAGLLAGLIPVLALSADRRGVLLDALLGFGGALVLFAPWLPTLAYQAKHTGAPWAMHPSPPSLLHGVYRLLGDPKAAVALLLGGGAGLAVSLRRPRAPEAVAAVALLVSAIVALGVAFGYCQVSRAWASRYLLVLLPPVLLAASLGLARARGLGLGATLLILVAAIGIPNLKTLQDKSNVGRLAHAFGPDLRRDDLVIVTQPEQVADARYYLGGGLRYATTLGPTPDPRLMDWRDAMSRLRAAHPQATARRVLSLAQPGQRVLLVSAVTSASSWRAPWTRLVRRRTLAWQRLLAADPRLTRVREIRPDHRSKRSTVAGTLYAVRRG